MSVINIQQAFISEFIFSIMGKIKTFSGNIVDVLNSEVYPGTLKISHGRILDISQEKKNYKNYIIPGFIDSHIHIESSILPPSEFARAAVIHGTVGAVCDPHEIANVLGIEGVKYMIEDSKTVPMKLYFSAPSCVPATDFDSSGAVLGTVEVEELMKLDEIKCLGEVMNFPSILVGNSELIKKISLSKRYSKPVDGHAPGLRGQKLEKYINSGISTDHECLNRDEAEEKLGLGMILNIREGSAVSNFEELIPLLEKHYKSFMFCSDDKHPDDLIKGHINSMVKRAVNYDIDAIKVLRVACVNPVLHYSLDAGLLQRGDAADFLVVDNLKDFNVIKTVINGEIVAEEGRTFINRKTPEVMNNFKAEKKKTEDFRVKYSRGGMVIIEALDGEIVTGKLILPPYIADGYAVSDIKRDILKIAVVNRYGKGVVRTGFVKNFGLTEGAIASSVAHDSHNIIAVGVSNRDICRAINLIIENNGGICAVSDEEAVLPLPIAGLMSDRSYSEVAEKYTEVDSMAKSLGSKLKSPFMTLSFMALLVIPRIKLGDKGLFDVEKSEFIELFRR